MAVAFDTAVARMAALRVLPVVELPSAADAVPLARALLAGGIDVIEITMRTPDALEGLRAVRRVHPQMLAGAGTVRSVDDARAALDAGAQFIVSPGTVIEVIELCRTDGVPVLAGACTPTEVNAAVGAGADAVKFFPAEAMGGSRLLKALIAPFRNVPFVPTGGIDAGNLTEYLRLPNVIACGGSWMVAPSLVREGRFEEIEQLAREALAIAAEVTDA
jgi:2-dehydro-3-deoxyphosphogluconate aldolase/(4S)-4-hydroxy-2-oxoglutarate aldolase